VLGVSSALGGSGGAVRLASVSGSTPVPTATTRWRCRQCGNLTRFDVTRTARTREYVHVDLAGESMVEEREVLAEDVESVRCRWCDGVGTVELVARPGPGETAGPP
jgi:hypothetical protein